MTPFIETFTGRTFCPLAPSFPDICIEDVAHALSNQCRFSGHTRHFYSVAEHSVRVSRWIEARGYDHTDQLWGLLHDASEAYLVDLPTPLKADRRLGDSYRKAERRLMLAVCKRFSLPSREPQIVREADGEMLATEVQALMHGNRRYWKKLEHEAITGYRLVPWSPAVAESEFLKRYGELK